MGVYEGGRIRYIMSSPFMIHCFYGGRKLAAASKRHCETDRSGGWTMKEYTIAFAEIPIRGKVHGSMC